MSRSHRILKAVRLIHLYFGVFITPALFFFAFTGALQTFSLHETTPNSTYKPPAWAMTLAQIHKKATPVIPIRKQMVKPAGADHGPTQSVILGADHAADHGAGQTADHGTDRGSDHSAVHAASDQAAATAPVRTHHPLPLKIFFLLVSIGLFMSCVTGLYMTWKFTRNRIAIFATLIAGVVIPAILLMV